MLATLAAQPSAECNKRNYAIFNTRLKLLQNLHTTNAGSKI